MYLFYFFALVGIWLGIKSLRGGLRYRAYVRREAARALVDFTPFVSVIAPSRGLDEGLSENIAALFHQNYHSYEILFVCDRPDDPSVKVIEKLKAANDSRVPARLIIAGAATDSGQKVH